MKRSHHLVLPTVALIAALAFPSAGRAAAPRTGEDLTVELVTIEPGDDMFSRFGHNGLRLIDPASPQGPVDFFFHWGRAKFESWVFFFEYLNGTAKFSLELLPWPKAVARYSRYDRTIVRQRLELTPAQRLELAYFLADASRREPDYVYDQLEDNCSTRVRDVIDKVTDGALRRAVAGRQPGRSYRDYTLEHGAGALSVQLGIDLIAGPHHDLEPDGWQEMYLPLYLQRAASRATLDVGGRPVPLLGEPTIEYQRAGDPPLTGSFFHGRILFLVLAAVFGAFVLGAAWLRRKQHRAGPLVGRAAGLTTLFVGLFFGILGALLMELALVSQVDDYAWSQNTLVFLPFDLWLVGAGFRWLALGRWGIGKPLKIYLQARLAVLGLLVLAKLVGIADYQDNWTFIGVAVLVLAPMAFAVPVADRS